MWPGGWGHCEEENPFFIGFTLAYRLGASLNNKILMQQVTG
jgi:hypothetical protein